MESTGELEWFRGEIWRSLVRPRDFARDLAREHYGLAGVLVVLGAGVGLSIGIDLLVLVTKGIAPGPFVGRMLTDAMLLAARLAITTAAVASVAAALVRLMRGRGASLDQLFTALTFGTAPLMLVPLPALVVTIAPDTAVLAVAAAIVLALALRVIVGLALNIRGILPPLVALVTFTVVVTLGAFVLGDQISRMRFLSYAVAPQLVSDFPVAPATGKRYELLGFDLTVPDGWTQATSGVPGEAGRFESSTSTLVIARARAAALDTADTYADVVSGPQKVGLKDIWQQRTVTRINGVLVVDDRYGGTYEGRHVVWRQFTAVPAAQGLALVYRVVEPADAQAALDEAASIAATWRIAGASR